ncbi:hypothetical protein PUNSTDRAFT_67873 [Punctularia strigosozonata HHB-11173 SS5]|uniref:uncharacterized protein n=1 Tax=Punctularia strigosozonata (strain HHB-11173) TaxID=741275 RepID=UPI000441781E|nr:uncharacterized protein PUNSTDRAFT_67873 [Punctularia strigosozonata HHB-11173 SS5]EIN08769.1 hypothetical protein PUNSTDRAFT_67873 [Punctularia strigosozonata HHB-11173 SS5]
MSVSSRNVSPDARSSASVEHWAAAAAHEEPEVVEWDWDAEHEDRRREAKADVDFARNGQLEQVPFQVDRKLLKDIVKDKMEKDVGRINFISSGTFHKAYLITLVDGEEVVARVARKFMPRIKTESEVATMQYLRKYTSVPVPEVYHYDANQYNRLGGEFIIMSKARGIPLSQVYYSLGHNELLALLDNTAKLLIPLFGHRFPKLGSLQFAPEAPLPMSSTLVPPTPTASDPPKGFGDLSFPTLPPSTSPPPVDDIIVGPIISWPFFGSNRGLLSHPQELDRGPWSSTHAYLESCAQREITGVIRENEGKAVPHKLHLDPDEVQSSRHPHHLAALENEDESEASTEWDWEESEQEWDGPGDNMYRDYRRMQRGTFLLSHMQEREQKVREEMERFMRVMQKLGVKKAEATAEGAESGAEEEFALDCHDLSLENVFVDENDHSKITCIIDWESTTTRPLWASAHLPAYLQSSPFTAKLFRRAVHKLAHGRTYDPASPRRVRNLRPRALEDLESEDVEALAAEWLYYEASGAKLRSVHRCIEWDGWEEGLIDSILGPPEQEEELVAPWEQVDEIDEEDDEMDGVSSRSGSDSPISDSIVTEESSKGTGQGSNKKKKRPPFATSEEREKEKLLNATGDICGGRGGELGRRLEHWLHETSHGEEDDTLRKWAGEDPASEEVQ